MFRRPTARSATAVVVRRVVIDSTPTRRESKQGKLAGSALSPETWRRTVESVRDLTVRK